LASFDGGSFPERAVPSGGRAPQKLVDAIGLASGALVYELALAPGQKVELGVLAPLGHARPRAATLADLDAQRAQTLAQWREKLNRVELVVPGKYQALSDTLRSSLAYVLINRDGPAIQPGSRAYERSWIRDGAMTSEMLLRLGHEKDAKEFLLWYAKYQFANGKVPCCVDRRGADPVPENDSAGEFLFLIDSVYRYTGDEQLLRQLWPATTKAVAYMDKLRLSERTEANQQGDRKAFYGLMPASISHEGYSAKPMHSYWDDFWALKGYASASMIADALGDAKAAKRLGSAHDEFRRDLYASLTAAAALHRIDYLPGSVELGDFDATSTTIALAPRGDPLAVPDPLLTPTFERYWTAFAARRDGKAEWNEYAPYELRTVGTFVRLGFRERAHELLDFFMEGRRPAAWNQWPEVVGRELRKPLFIGDLPHAWVASDYIRAVLDLFAYEGSDGAMILAGGIPAAWLDRAGVSMRGVSTPYGTVSYSLVRTDQRIAELTVSASGRLPPGGFVLAGPWQRPLHATINGKPAIIRGNELRIDELEAKVVLQLSR
jgi:hypothetical protein